jgi:organic hydroperoxide reductase OsmC/OhrA
MAEHNYHARVEWTGNDGAGTASRTFARDNEIAAPGRPTIPGSAPAEFGGDGLGWAPEDLFVAAVSQCHMLTYLFLCARAGIVVESYRDEAFGTLSIAGGTGRITVVELDPVVTISAGDPVAAQNLHADASAGCFIGNSVTCEVHVRGSVTAQPAH